MYREKELEVQPNNNPEVFPPSPPEFEPYKEEQIPSHPIRPSRENNV